jgi:uncharacterized protein
MFVKALPYARRGFHYNSYKFYLEDRFGERVQRISLEGGFSCPNRDGSLDTRACIYCNNASFSPPYAAGDKSITEQLESGIHFLKRRFTADKFIAYFQSGSNTYAPIQKLEKYFREALDHPQVVGLSVSTRPDCVPNDVLALLRDIRQDTDVNLELGLESLYDPSLEWINRCHDVACSLDALERAAAFDLDVTAHIILGLPTETRREMLQMATMLSDLPLTFLKLHHLQIIKDTRLEKLYKTTPFSLFEYETYMELVAEFIALLRPGLILQRVISSAPDRYLIAPKWQQTTTAFLMDLQKYMRENNLWQGDRYVPRQDKQTEFTD